MNNVPPELYGPEEARAEHRACVDYHTSLVNSRFTVAGLYVAAMGFIAAAVFRPETTWYSRGAISFLACWLTICLWILELRSRALFTLIAQRGIEIERRYWGLVDGELMAGFFSRQHRVPSELSAIGSTAEPRRKNPDRPVLAFFPKRPLPIWISRGISHSMGLDLLFAGGLIFWLVATGISMVSGLSSARF
jgi:hypothetical protein